VKISLAREYCVPARVAQNAPPKSSDLEVREWFVTTVRITPATIEFIAITAVQAVNFAPRTHVAQSLLTKRTG
jgi:hypothetical protein